MLIVSLCAGILVGGFSTVLTLLAGYGLVAALVCYAGFGLAGMCVTLLGFLTRDMFQNLGSRSMMDMETE